ncbi:VCBS repeat-containing protein [Streptomyces sp. G2]|uniref:FG-GAP repeat domain-containing protein n=1 Tax=Streptomyces sp. G2 TaxID=1684471 RepID=UPI00202DF111|nr:VCBS repeat-containing protein [Streptomyces sp. G2]MCM1946193.1 VCBS repeat-containing protein [Streptomyces sp. G2]
MAKTSGLNRTGVLARVTVAAVTAALVGTTTAAVAAEPGPAFKPTSVPAPAQQSDRASAFAATATTAAPLNPLYGVNSAGDVWGYIPVSGGGIQRLADKSGDGWTSYKHFVQSDVDSRVNEYGYKQSDGWYSVRSDGRLNYTDGGPLRDLGGGWNIYNKVFSVGNTGGGAPDDLLARDSAGVLWHYLGYSNAGLTGRYRVGSGWNAYTQLAGKGDITGDGRADLVARDRNGVLWLYKGTGLNNAPFTARTRIGSGWNTYNLLVSSGDLTGDGRADLVARDGSGALWLYKGRGSSSAPYTARVKIGTSGWNSFRALF